jgi:arginine repressor
LAQFGVRVTAAQNIVVVQSELGSAPAIARALDRVEHPKIVGTLAGDDTCLVITHGGREAREVARELSAAIG